MLSVLFVCMGNICRSPAASAVLSVMAKQKDEVLYRQLHIESAGVMGWNIGCQPDKRMAEAAGKRGFKLTGTAQVFDPTDFERFHFIFASDPAVWQQLAAMASTSEEKEKIHLMTDFAPSLELKGIPDPYHYTEEGFERVLDMIEACCEGIIEFLIKQRKKQ